MNQADIQREILKNLYTEWFVGRNSVALRRLANERQWEERELNKAIERLEHEYLIEVVGSELLSEITKYGILEAESAGVAPAGLREKSGIMRTQILDRLGRDWDENGPHHHVHVDDLVAASGADVEHYYSCLRLLIDVGYIEGASCNSYNITPSGNECVQEWRKKVSC